jgi:hypothetical protein
LNVGLDLCTHELIFRMDSDDIMVSSRISTQVEFMEKNPQCMICGTQITPFRSLPNNYLQRVTFSSSKHSEFISWIHFLKTPTNWFMNHPTLCYRKKAVEIIGKYNSDDEVIAFSSMEDFELELKFLKRFGAVYNINIPLLHYRSHDNQITQKIKQHTNKQQLQNYIIQSVVYSK